MKNENELNTYIYYTYRDADNYKTDYEFIVSGTINDNEKNIIREALDEGELFIPSQLTDLNLPDIQFKLQQYDSADWDVDHCWHELDVEDIEATSDAPTVSFTAKELVEAFQNAIWDDSFVQPHVLYRNV